MTIPLPTITASNGVTLARAGAVEIMGQNVPLSTANDDTPPRRAPARWPLGEEFNAGRIGVDEAERYRLEAAVRWFCMHVEQAVNPGHYGTNTIAAAMGGVAYKVKADDWGDVGLGDPGIVRNGITASAVDSSRDMSLLLPLERKARSMQIIRLCRRRLGHLFDVAAAAIMLRWEMRAIGKAPGIGANSEAAAGRATVVSALRLVADVRADVEELEDADRIDPETLSWHFGRPANDNNRQAAWAA